ncbi:NAD-dependent succinate-semialdehyde dehydrogenase [Streptosporangium lutulentum]|uniref:Succinate-semialdehyde dehydrogenase/glutarate-semialdehyde dehydrogenase n=1 Tax=Streptosporangium lutulentum TaxID=1461250 RepID=A0ABT9QPW9_9ACTN|nr:NAD-dependent succinate-semialdehyde dehydrogenase [Streptosporangium lutulentum]MDP9848791.1 succinate-semialdehyde dehydrogenase/glutarate-semialdehyde dehydrogenase [Streptosporangium lutulentum]
MSEATLEASPGVGRRTTPIHGHEVPTGIHIGGRWIDLDATFDVTDPATGSAFAAVSDASEAEALQALDAAEKAQRAWGSLNPRRRARLLRHAHDLVRERADAFIDVMVVESGKPRAEAAAEFELSMGFFEWSIEQIGHLHGDFGPGSNPGYRVVTSLQPIGPSLLITPWNFPMLMGARKMSAALAAGCTLVVKSAQQTPFTIALLVQALQDAGVPDGVVNLIHTMRSEAASTTLLADRRLKKLSFTGSTAVGSHLLTLAARHITHSSMELGGNAPFIVLDDADVDLAVREAVVCKFRNAGQACVAANRIILHRDIADEFTEKFTAAAEALKIGPGFADGVQMGPMISAQQRQRIDQLVRGAVAEGAELLTGGKAVPGEGFFYEPTVLRGAGRSSRLACDELFGPVAMLYTVDSVAEAIDFANDTEYGLSAYLFTRDISRAIRIGEELECGMVGVNRGIMADPVAPFGGTKASGLGREGGDQGVKEFLEAHYIALTIDDERAQW